MAKEGIVNPTSDMVTGWDSSVAGEKTIEFKYKEFSREYKIKFIEEDDIIAENLYGLFQSKDGTFTNVSYFYVPKGKELKGRVNIELTFQLNNGSSESVKFDNSQLEINGFDKDKTGFQYTDVSYKGCNCKILVYVYDDGSKPVIDRYYYRSYLTSLNNKIIYLEVPESDSLGDFVYRDVYIDGSLSDSKNVSADRLEGFDLNNIKTFSESEYDNDLARKQIRAGNLSNVYAIKDQFTVDGKKYNKTTYVAFYQTDS